MGSLPFPLGKFTTKDDHETLGKLHSVPRFFTARFLYIDRLVPWLFIHKEATPVLEGFPRPPSPWWVLFFPSASFFVWAEKYHGRFMFRVLAGLSASVHTFVWRRELFPRMPKRLPASYPPLLYLRIQTIQSKMDALARIGLPPESILNQWPAMGSFRWEPLKILLVLIS